MAETVFLFVCLVSWGFLAGVLSIIWDQFPQTRRVGLVLLALDAGMIWVLLRAGVC